MNPAVKRALEILAARVGLAEDGASTRRLVTALNEGSARRNLTLDAYLDAVETDAEAFQDFVDRVTVQETAFFRHPQQLEFLGETLLKTLPEPLVIWSAACSNGQEPYSLAILLEELGLKGTIYASDISSRALARTRAARYEGRELGGLSEERRARFLKPVDGMFEFVPEIRNRVKVARHNLATDTPPMPRGTCHLVLCRNVLIYFSNEETVAFLRRLHAHMPVGGHLMVGGTESLLHVTDVFEIERRDRVYLYRRTAQGASGTVRSVRNTPASAAPAPGVRRGSRLSAVDLPGGQKEQRPTRTASFPTPSEIAGASDTVDITAIRRKASAAAARGAWSTAAAAYRQLLYLAPNDPVASVELGLVLEAAGDHGGAARAFRVARRALKGHEIDQATADIGGYRLRELEQLLDTKLEEAA
jgi:chemotaxis methyl-accepting protein methylase